MLQKGDSLTNKLTSLRDATKMSLSYPGTAVPAGILQFWSLELVLWAPFVLCPMPSLLLMQGSKREEENENERGTQTCWEIRLKVSQQPTMIQCCFWIFPAAGVWSKTSRESSLSRKREQSSRSSSHTDGARQQSCTNLWFVTATLPISTTDVLKHEISCSTALEDKLETFTYHHIC